MRNKVAICFLVFLICLSAVACTRQGNTIPGTSEHTEPGAMNNLLPIQLAVNIYVSFFEGTKSTPRDAIDEYCHYELNEYYYLDMEHCTKTLEYEIVSIKQLSNQLWSIEVFVKNEQIKLGQYAMQYVGVVDGEYKVMLSSKQIPPDLKEGIEIEDYEAHGPGIIDPGDVQ